MAKDPPLPAQGRHASGNGQRMSRGERLIARALEEHGIRYRYEQPVAVVSQGRVCICYPDFYLPDYHAILEYAGVQGSPEYDRQLRWKAEQYRGLGMQALILDAESFESPWPMNLLGRLGKGRPESRDR